MRWHPLLLAVSMWIGHTGHAGHRPGTTAHRAWPHRVHVSGAAGGAATFHATARDGAILVTERGRGTDWWRPMGALVQAVPLAPGDTARGTAPAQLVLDLTRGAVVLASTGREGLRVVVSHNGSGGRTVTAVGTRLTLRSVDERLEVRVD